MAWDRPGVAAPLRVVWDYMRLVHPPVAADAILTLGSFDVQAAVHAARLLRPHERRGRRASCSEASRRRQALHDATRLGHRPEALAGDRAGHVVRGDRRRPLLRARGRSRAHLAGVDRRPAPHIRLPGAGFQGEQAVPAAVIEAMRRLVEAGYGARLRCSRINRILRLPRRSRRAPARAGVTRSACRARHSAGRNRGRACRRSSPPWRACHARTGGLPARLL